MFNDYQKEQILFHLDIDPRGGSNYPDRVVTVDVTSPEQELITIGDLDIAIDADCVFIDSIKVCTNVSVLGECIRAYQKLSVDTIEDSLLVSQAGNVKLRSDELRARQSLYKDRQKRLRTILGYSTRNRVGFRNGF